MGANLWAIFAIEIFGFVKKKFAVKGAANLVQALPKKNLAFPKMKLFGSDKNWKIGGSAGFGVRWSDPGCGVGQVQGL
jgi:hypothetical protein